MILNHLKSAFRNLKRQLVFSSINILGLAVAIACVLFIYLWVQDELSFDKFHSKSNSINRVIMDMGEYGKLALTPPPLIDKIKQDFPEIINATRVEECPKIIVKNKDKIFYEENGIFADPSFFEMFSFGVTEGNDKNLLKEPFSIVITENTAKKYFGEKNPLNENLLINGNPIKVSGVVKNLPHNSHLQFDFVLPISLAAQLGEDLSQWGNVNLYTYVELNNKTDFSVIDKKIRNWNTPREETFFLQPLKDIHGETAYLGDNAVVANRTYVNIFSAIALFILLIASINYISIYVSSSFNRAKEIGIRKVNGSNRKNILLQFISESSVYIIIAIVIALLLVSILLPQFNNLTNKHLSFLFSDLNFIVRIFLLGILLLVTIGLYPAMLFSSVKPSLVLKNNKGKSGLLSKLRNVMILAQFSITTVLIVSVFIVSKQINYIQNKDLGFQKENVIYMPFNGLGEHYENFKQELLKNNSIVSISAKNSLPTEIADKTTDITWPGKISEQKLLSEATAVEFDYVETMGLNMVEGRSFSTKYSNDKHGVILNQSAVNQMGLKDPVGKEIELWGYPGTIIGVMNDALFYSLKSKVEPQILYMIQDINDEDLANRGVFLLRIEEANIQSALAYIENTLNKFYTDVPFNFHFLDKAIEAKYWEEQRLFSVMKYFVFISILLSCLGLFGMSLFTTRQRVKEIGIRKVNGAKIAEVMTMLNKDFIKWVIIAFMIAAPISWYVMNKWLEGFAYKATLSWWVFVLAGIVTLSIALLTVSWQTWRAARRNPVEALRYE